MNPSEEKATSVSKMPKNKQINKSSKKRGRLYDTQKGTQQFFNIRLWRQRDWRKVWKWIGKKWSQDYLKTQKQISEINQYKIKLKSYARKLGYWEKSTWNIRNE